MAGLFSSAVKGAVRKPQARRSSSRAGGLVMLLAMGWAFIVVAAVVGLAVEVEVGLGGEAVEGALVPDFDAV